MKQTLLLFAVAFLMTGCKTIEYVPVKEVVHDSIYFSKVQKDSVWLHDSILVREHGDTVWMEKWHTKYVERIKTDTILEIHTDSIPVPYEVIKEVPAKKSKTEKTLMWIGILSLMAIILYIGRWVSRRANI